MGNLCDKHYLIAEEASEDGTVDNCIVCNLEEQHKADKALLDEAVEIMEYVAHGNASAFSPDRQDSWRNDVVCKAEQFLDKVSKEELWR